MAGTIAGIGTSFHIDYAAELAATEAPIDFLEVVPERLRNEDGQPSRRFEPFAERWPIVTHSTGFGLGGLEPVAEAFLAYMAQAIERWNVRVCSDHAGYTTLSGRPLFTAMAPPFSEAAAAALARSVREAQGRIGVPLLVENVPVYARSVQSTMEEASFLAQVLEAADCGLLLDLTTVAENARNGAYVATAFIDSLPVGRIAQIHLRGCMPYDPGLHRLLPDPVATDVVVETHEGPVSDEVWALFRHTLRRVGTLVPTCVEWEGFVPDFDEVLAHVDAARQHAAAALGAPFVPPGARP